MVIFSYASLYIEITFDGSLEGGVGAGDPVAERCEDEGNEGVTGFVVITTSHASVHIWDTGLVQIDVFSCRHFWNQDVLDYIYGQFGDLTSIEVKSIDRTPS